jgi:thioredoxin-dependent peroxiredoxin
VTVRNSGLERGASRLSKIAEGRRAPVFTLEDAPGRRVLTADFKGKDVIVYFYPKDDVPGCPKEA